MKDFFYRTDIWKLFVFETKIHKEDSNSDGRQRRHVETRNHAYKITAFSYVLKTFYCVYRVR